MGIRDAALDWFKSYLSQRRQFVVINGTPSSHLNLSFGVPQGSVLGQILFTLYTTPLGAIARKYQLSFHLHADDRQLYMAFKPNNVESLPLVISNIQNCVIDIKSWMTANMVQNRGFSTSEQTPQNSNYHEQKSKLSQSIYQLQAASGILVLYLAVL